MLVPGSLARFVAAHVAPRCGWWWLAQWCQAAVVAQLRHDAVVVCASACRSLSGNKLTGPLPMEWSGMSSLVDLCVCWLVLAAPACGVPVQLLQQPAACPPAWACIACVQRAAASMHALCACPVAALWLALLVLW